MRLHKISGIYLDHALHLALGNEFRQDDKYGFMYLNKPSDESRKATSWQAYPKRYSQDSGLVLKIIKDHVTKIQFNENTSNEYFVRGGDKSYSDVSFETAVFKLFILLNLGYEVDIPDTLAPLY